MGTGDSAFTSASASGSTVSGPLDWPRLMELHRVLKPTGRQQLQLPLAEQARQAAPPAAQSPVPPRQGAPRRDQAAERTLRSLMTASADAPACIGALAEIYSRE